LLGFSEEEISSITERWTRRLALEAAA